MSVLLVNSTIAKIRSMYPESVSAWPDATLQNAVYMADLLVKERAESMWRTGTIPLVANGLYYALPETCIWLGAVSFGRDGSTFKNGTLSPTTLADLDEHIPDWENYQSSKPTHYVLLSAPGIKEYSKIILWPAMSSANGEAVQIEYIGCHNKDALFWGQASDQWVVDDIYAPIVAAFMVSGRDPQRAADLFSEGMAACSRLFEQSRAKYGDFYSPYNTNDHRLTR